MRSILSNIQTNFGGIKTPKVLVFQSDDWGFSRTDNDDRSLEFLKSYNLDKSPFNSLDGLESTDDLKSLEKLLESCSDTNGNTPIFTLNYVTSNPDFQAIEECNFENYHRVFISDSEAHIALYDYWKLPNKIFDVQFHGLDHVNINEWMKQLRAKSVYSSGFKHNLIEFTNPKIDENMMVALRGVNGLLGAEYFKQGIECFNNFFHKVPISFIPPNYWINDELLSTVENAHITSIQGMKYRFTSGNGSHQRKVRKNGKTEGKSNLISLVRNIQLEPSLQPNKSIEEIVKNAIQSLRVAYLLGQPAIVDTHRINYTARYSKLNSERGLEVLQLFINEAQKLFPEIQFWSTTQLTYFYKNIYESNK